ncbi:MAG: hypothetical protein M1840_001411 [Geoglossum simile]|nr:MAG: hypothetical protein M1840_001411 [Geoglossum simile]
MARNAVFAGVLSHLLVFIHREWDESAQFIALAGVLVPTALFLYLGSIGELSWMASLRLVSLESASYGVGLFGSIVIYRALFHRLRKFPGPCFARLTAFWSFREALFRHQWFRTVEQLHKTYGDFVRITLHDYESRVFSHSLELVSQLTANAGKVVDATSWFKYFGLDVMGDLTFGKSFNTLKDGTPHPVLKRLDGRMALVSLLGNAPWTSVIFRSLPVVRAGMMNWLRCVGRELTLVSFAQMIRDRPDIFSHLIDDDARKTRDPVINKGMLIRDSQLLIIAGSDTTSSTLTNAFYRLAKHPNILRMLRKEIDPLFASGEDFSYELIADLPYLEGVINETLRLHPPVPSGLQRVTPKEGITIAGTYIPGDTIVSAPTHILHRGTLFAKK